MSTDLGTENLLSLSDGEDAQTLRDRLALSTQYLANWYKATKGSDNQDVWWQKIDTLRFKIEAVYTKLLQPLNEYFAGHVEKADYDDASAAWAALYRELLLSADTIDTSLIDQAASFTDTLLSAPGLLATRVGNELGKAAGGALGGFLAQTWPYLLGAGVLGVAYVFRAPLARLIGKAAA